ncbi:MAG: hypothetical protein JWM10_405 [Myxococcaceae bacterium]|nr:hypothetical protein [Myxococcaceae bacterium]
MRAVDDPIELAWNALLTEWESPERHKAFVALAAAQQRLPDAARHYRECQPDPARAERAKQGIDAVLRVALLSLAPMPRRENEVARKVRGALLPVSLAMALVVFTLMGSQALHQPGLASPWVLAGEVAVALLVPWQKLLARDE